MTDPIPDRIPDRAFREGPRHGISEENWFSGATSLFRRRYAFDPTGADVAVLGVPFDQAVSNRPGTRFGPRAIRAASSALTWPGAPWRWPEDPFANLDVVDTGDLNYDTGDPSAFAGTLEARAREILGTGAKLLSLGGDHFVTYPLLKAHAAKHGPLALIQFDAHSDTWREPHARIDHGTMFFHATQQGIIDPQKSIQMGIRSGNEETHGFEVVDADTVADETPDELAARIYRRVGGSLAYLTFDIDFLDPAYAPGTGTPVCGGPSSGKAERILCALKNLQIVGMDVVEVSPPYDHADITALAGATMALNMVGLFAAQKAREE